jgi:hypothetical protein
MLGMIAFNRQKETGDADAQEMDEAGHWRNCYRGYVGIFEPENRGENVRE